MTVSISIRSHQGIVNESRARFTKCCAWDPLNYFLRRLSFCYRANLINPVASLGRNASEGNEAKMWPKPMEKSHLPPNRNYIRAEIRLKDRLLWCIKYIKNGKRCKLEWKEVRLLYLFSSYSSMHLLFFYISFHASPLTNYCLIKEHYMIITYIFEKLVDVFNKKISSK